MYPFIFFLVPCGPPVVESTLDYLLFNGESDGHMYSHHAVLGFMCIFENQMLSGPSLVSCYDGEWQPKDSPTCVGEQSSFSEELLGMFKNVPWLTY